MVNLGSLYHCQDGIGVEQDYARANTLYREAIEVDNNTNALLNLGLSYSKGRGVEKCEATALSFWQKAADLGVALAQRRIGNAYMRGNDGYSKNIQLARKYIKASSAQGNVDAVALLKEWNACAHCGAAEAPKV
jgi:TPR repeat protein